jgi:hypothetical protein
MFSVNYERHLYVYFILLKLNTNECDRIKDITVSDNCRLPRPILLAQQYPSTAQTRGEEAAGSDKWKLPICEQQWMWKGVIVAGRSSKL